MATNNIVVDGYHQEEVRVLFANKYHERPCKWRRRHLTASMPWNIPTESYQIPFSTKSLHTNMYSTMAHACGLVGCSNRSNRYEKSFLWLPTIIKHQGQQTEELSSRRRNMWLQRMQDLPDFIFWSLWKIYCLQRRWSEIPFIWVYSVLYLKLIDITSMQ